MNWGYKILTVIMVFITGMGTMITIAMRQKNDLVDEQYYARELRHQELIDAGKNLKNLPGAVIMSNEQHTVVIKVPKAASHHVKESSLSFICPSDKRRDYTPGFAPDTNGVFRMPAQGLVKGQYLVRLYWKSRGIPYYSEQSFRIN